MVEGHSYSFNCSIICSWFIPDLKAIETSLAVASDWEGHPPARPVLVNTSQIPSSS